jgi:RHS repeat-associated protein
MLEPEKVWALTNGIGLPGGLAPGAALLTLTDCSLQGILPFEFIRHYRIGAAHLDCGLGFGWSHCLAHRLDVEAEQVIWTDDENCRTTFSRPTIPRPLSCNSLPRPAIYLGDALEEWIIALPGRFLHFRTGQLTAISDAYGNRLTLQRDCAGRIQRLDNGAGRALLLRWDRRYLAAVEYQCLDSVTPLDKSWRTEQVVVSYRHDACHHLISATNAANESERYDYDEQHLLLQRQLAGGASLFWEWEKSEEVVRCVRHWGSFAQLDRRYLWDEYGGVTVKHIDGSQRMYPPGSRPAQRQTSGDHGFLRPPSRADAGWKYLRNAQGDVIRATDPQGHVTQLRYDSRGQLSSIEYPDNSHHNFTHDALGQLREETLPDGSQRLFSYDALGRQISLHDENGGVTRYQWDAVGRLVLVTLPSGANRAFSCNAYGMPTAERCELGRVTRFEYADDLHLVSRRLNSDGSQLKYRHDHPLLLLTEVQNEFGERYQLDYLPHGLLQEETAIDGRRIGYVYDPAGHLSQKTEFGNDGSQLVTRYQRNEAGQLLVKTLADGSTVEYQYNPLGRLVGVIDDHQPLIFEYDMQDRLIAEHQGGNSLRYRHDACGRLNYVHLPDDSTLDIHYAKGGALAAINLNGARLSTHRLVAGRELQRQQGSLSSTYGYDDQGRLTSHALSLGAAPFYRRDFSYSANGNLERIADSRNGTRNYQYDYLDRLIRVHHSREHQPESFVHDPAGNLLMLDRPGPVTLKTHRLLKQGNRHYTYDAFGNLIRKCRGTAPVLVTEYRYDCQHRLVGITLPCGAQVSYRYDAFGRRISKTVDGKSTVFIWQGNTLIAESSEGHYRGYLYEPGTFRPLAMLDGKGPDNARPYYYQLDHLGTPQELTDASGQVVWAAQYTAYGRLTRLNRDTHRILEQPLRFQGQYFDAESGLHYNRHRYYNPDVGRYLTPGHLAHGWNGYQYLHNPTGWVAPSGSQGLPNEKARRKPGQMDDEIFSSVHPMHQYRQCPDHRDWPLHPHASHHPWAPARPQCHRRAVVDPDAGSPWVKAMDIQAFHRGRMLWDQDS